MGIEYIINGTEEVIDAFTADKGIVVPSGQTINNEGSYAGTPIVTSITAGSGINVTNPTSPGAATVDNIGVLSIAGTDGVTPSASTGNVSISLSAVPNTSLAGDLVSSITAGTGISVTNPTGVGAATVGFLSAGTSLGTFTTGTSPIDVAIDQSGNVWVTNYGSNTLEKFTSAGTSLGTFTTGTNPIDIAIDQSGNVWVANQGSDTLQKFNSSGTLLGTFTTGTAPFGVAIDQSGNVWVANSGSATIQKFSSTGSLLGTFTTGTAPFGVAIDQSGNVWVANNSSDTIQKFSSTGSLLGTFTTGTYPRYVAIDQSGNVWVSNQGSNTLEKFSSTGSLLGTFTTGTTPIGVAIDQSGNVWVANNSSDTLQVFAGGEPYGVICPLVLEYSALSYSNLNMTFLPAQSAVTTSSTAMVSTGLGVLFTPSKTGTVIIEVSAFGNNNTLADGIQVGVGYTAGSSLIALGTAMGAEANGYTEAIATVAGDNSNLSFTAYIQGLQSGTEYAIQPTFASITAGTSTLTITSMIIEEK